MPLLPDACSVGEVSEVTVGGHALEVALKVLEEHGKSIYVLLRPGGLLEVVEE